MTQPLLPLALRRCRLTLLPNRRGLKPFDLIIYGRSACELMTVPNKVIHTLAGKYPDYSASLFLLEDL